MYKFNYQYEPQYDAPFITCIVPTEWIVLDLPTLGGAVVYQDKLKQAEKPTDFVFEFAEIQDASRSGRTFTLKIHRPLEFSYFQNDYCEVFDKTIRIHYLDDAHTTTKEEPSAEVVLLNHLHCNFAGSSFTGMSFIDLHDMFTILSLQSDLCFKYTIGLDTNLMIQNILDGLGDISSANAFPVMFGKFGSVGLKMFSEMNTRFDGSPSTLCLGYTPAVDQDEFLISVLVTDMITSR